MSFPFFYEPVRLGTSTLVDGGMLSNFPVDIFDSSPDCPTFGVKLSARPEANLVINAADDTFGFTKAILATLLNAHDQMHLEDPCAVQRTIFVDTTGVQTLDFNLSREQQELLYENGRTYAAEFLGKWNPKTYGATCMHIPKHS